VATETRITVLGNVKKALKWPNKHAERAGKNNKTSKSDQSSKFLAPKAKFVGNK
jgi:hypothetical protein